MGDYDDTITVQVPPQQLFAYLSDVRNLPHYLPRLTEATPQGGDKVDVTAHIDPEGQPAHDVHSEAWMRVVKDEQTLEWGAPGPGDYHGRLEIAPGEHRGESTLTVYLHTDHVEGDQIRQGLAETLRGIRDTVENTPDRPTDHA
ncbi:SRPBCC family protein [Actinocrispum sp. NPDC049592]|uniref:SRPBCC family protein n=1 Tax=Actinocrispum sp. NPDC049592 TaxID=3154835 RepID=UPI00342E0A78